MDLTDKLAKDISRDDMLGTLRTATRKLIAFYLGISCPCAFPRFRFLVGFDGNEFSKSLVHTFETNLLAGASIHISDFLVKDEKSDNLFRCRVCGTQYAYVYEQFSISFELARFVITDNKAIQKGADVVFPFPLFGGLYLTDGVRSEEDIQKDMDVLNKKFPSVTLGEFIEYMKVQ